MHIMLLRHLQIATYKVRTVRVLEESRINDSANDGSGHIDKPFSAPMVPSMSTTSVCSLLSCHRRLKNQLRRLAARVACLLATGVCHEQSECLASPWEGADWNIGLARLRQGVDCNMGVLRVAR